MNRKMKKITILLLITAFILTGCRNSVKEIDSTSSYNFHELSYELSDEFGESSRNDENVLYESEKRWISIDRWDKDYSSEEGELITINNIEGYYKEHSQMGTPVFDYKFEFTIGDYVFYIRSDTKNDLYELINTLEVEK